MLKFAVMSVVTLTLMGCAHGTMRGSVAMKTSDQEAHVCLGNKEVKVGDKVVAFRNVCPTKGSPRLGDGSAGVCRKEQLGEGTITKLLNEHYSVVQFGPNVSFDEGTFVEKQ